MAVLLAITSKTVMVLPYTYTTNNQIIIKLRKLENFLFCNSCARIAAFDT